MSKETQLKELVVEMALEQSQARSEIQKLNGVISQICAEIVGESEQVTLDEVIARVHELRGAEMELREAEQNVPVDADFEEA